MAPTHDGGDAKTPWKIHRTVSFPEALGAVIETFFPAVRRKSLHPAPAFAAAAIGRSLLRRLQQGRVTFISQLERAAVELRKGSHPDKRYGRAIS